MVVLVATSWKGTAFTKVCDDPARGRRHAPVKLGVMLEVAKLLVVSPKLDRSQ
jgi:hypothetical protein